MPGFVIHIAVAKEYMNKHENEIRDEKEFLNGIIAPDLIPKLNKNITKSESHYGKKGFSDIEAHLDLFLADPKVDITKDYYKGYFIHLVTDNEFYLNYFKDETQKVMNNKDSFYYDYDCLNERILKKYEIVLIEEIKMYMKSIKGTPKYLKPEKVVNFIEEMSNINLKEQEEINRKVKNS